MRAPNLGTVFYAPSDPPSDSAEMARFLREELTKIAGAVAALAAGHLDQVTVAPAKPRDGDIRYADGVLWQPNGTGPVGIWYYKASAALWVLLG